MPGKTIVIAPETGDRDTVDLFGNTYTVKPVTRSVQKALEKVEKKLKDLDNDDSDAVVSLMAEGIDALLEADGHEKTAKAVVVDQWKADALSFAGLNRMYEQIQESAAGPT